MADTTAIQEQTDVVRSGRAHVGTVDDARVRLSHPAEQVRRTWQAA